MVFIYALLKRSSSWRCSLLIWHPSVRNYWWCSGGVGHRYVCDNDLVFDLDSGSEGGCNQPRLTNCGDRLEPSQSLWIVRVQSFIIFPQAHLSGALWYRMLLHSEFQTQFLKTFPEMFPLHQHVSSQPNCGNHTVSHCAEFGPGIHPDPFNCRWVKALTKKLQKSDIGHCQNIWYWLFWNFDRRKKLQWCFQCPVHCAIDVIPFCALAVKLNPWETHTWGGEGELPGAATSFDDGDRRETEILTTCLRNILTSRQPPTATESPDLQQLVMVSLQSVRAHGSLGSLVEHFHRNKCWNS